MTHLDDAESQAPTLGTEDPVRSLAEKARDGDRSAFERLIDLFHGKIFRMAYYRCGSQMDAEDLTQDIFLQAFRSISRLKDLDRFQSWLYSIALNRIRDFHRKKRLLAIIGVSTGENEPEQTDTEPHGDPDVLNQLLKHEFWSQVQQLSKKFSHWEREVFMLRFLDDLNIREIAQVLNKSESAVKTHLYRCIRKFKEDNEFIKFIEGKVP